MTKTTIILGVVAVAAASAAVSKIVNSRRSRVRVTSPARAANDDGEVETIDMVPESPESDIPHLEDD